MKIDRKTKKSHEKVITLKRGLHFATIWENKFFRKNDTIGGHAKNRLRTFSKRENALTVRLLQIEFI